MPWGTPVEERLTHSVVGAFFDVYNRLGFGFMERIYLRALVIELQSRGHTVSRERSFRVEYAGQTIGIYRLDLVVDDRLVVEAKSTSALPHIADRQLYNYLKASGMELGLLLHFGPRPSFRKVVCRHASD